MEDKVFVTDSVLKMDWEKKGFYKKNGNFYLASQEYTNSNGQVIPVYFCIYGAYFWADNGATTFEDLWQINDLMPVLKKNADDNFPTAYNEYVSLLNDDGTINDSMLERFNILEFKSDIEARMNDVSQYGEEFVGSF